jgi:hypothetical protein
MSSYLLCVEFDVAKVDLVPLFRHFDFTIQTADGTHVKCIARMCINFDLGDMRAPSWAGTSDPDYFKFLERIKASSGIRRLECLPLGFSTRGGDVREMLKHATLEDVRERLHVQLRTCPWPYRVAAVEWEAENVVAMWDEFKRGEWGWEPSDLEGIIVARDLVTEHDPSLLELMQEFAPGYVWIPAKPVVWPRTAGQIPQLGMN